MNQYDKKIKRRKLINPKIYRLCILMILFLTVGLSQTIHIKADQPKRKTVKVGYYIRKSFQEGDKDWKPKSGYSYEYMQKIASYTGWKYKYIYGTWEELYHKLESGEIDMMAGIADSKDRENKILYPNREMLNETFYIYMSQHDKTIKVGDIDSYKDKIIGIQKNNPKMVETLNRWMKHHDAKIRIKIYEDFNACAKAFHEKKIDGFVSADNIVSSYSGIVPVEKIGKEPYYLCVSKNQTQLLKELNNALGVIYEQDALSINELSNKYTAETAVSVFLSKEERDWMENHSTITVGYSKNYLPYSDITKKGKPTGLIKNIIPDLFKNLPGQYSPKIVYVAFEDQRQMIKSVRDGKIDIAFPVSDERWYSEQNQYQQTSSVVTAPIALAYKGRYKEETTKKIAVNKNNLLQYCYVTQKYPNAKITLYDSSKECIDAVKSGRVMATLVSAIQADRITDNNKELNTLTLTNSEKLCFGVSLNNGALLKLLNHGITILGESYGVDHVYHYVNEVTTYTLTDLIRDHIWIVIIVFIVVLLLIILYFMIHDKNQEERARKELHQKKMLEDALERAKQATIARTVFLRNMSHDIRTPLNAVIGFTDLALKGEKDINQMKDYLSKINISGKHLLEIVNEVLEISRIESGQTKLDERAWNLEEIVDEAEVIIREQAKEKKQDFYVDMSEVKDKYIYCDRLRMKEILLNLLGNSVKFTKQKGKISLEILQKACDSEGFASYQIIVKDNGCGMSQEFIDKIFEPFEREYTSTDSGVQGAGLGMPIVKHFVDMMNGTIQIVSKEGSGTKIIMEYKFCIANPVTQEKQEDINGEEYHFEEKRLLLAEDNELNREITEEVLKEVGFQIDSVENGEEAVKKLRSEAAGYYDAILMDIQMPVMDGYEATRQIRNLEDQKYATIPIIALSANAFEEDKASSFIAGMNDHLAKPLDVEKLMKILKCVLK